MVPGKTLLGNLTREEVSPRSSELVESFQSGMEKSSDIDVPAMSPLDDTIFESAENVAKPVSLSYLRVSRGGYSETMFQ